MSITGCKILYRRTVVCLAPQIRLEVGGSSVCVLKGHACLIIECDYNLELHCTRRTAGRLKDKCYFLASNTFDVYIHIVRMRCAPNELLSTVSQQSNCMLFSKFMQGVDRLPNILGTGLALPRLAVEVLRSGALKSSFIPWEVGGLDQGLVEELLLAEDAADGLVVDVLGQLEQESVVDGRLGLFFGLWAVSIDQCDRRGSTYVEQEFALGTFLSLLLEEDVANRVDNQYLAVLCNNAPLCSLRTGDDFRLDRSAASGTCLPCKLNLLALLGLLVHGALFTTVPGHKLLRGILIGALLDRGAGWSGINTRDALNSSLVSPRGLARMSDVSLDKLLATLPSHEQGEVVEATTEN